MYERTWLKTECKRLPEPLDRELERRLGMEKRCANCRYSCWDIGKDKCPNGVEACLGHNYPMQNNYEDWQPEDKVKKTPDPFNTQIGGSHYKDFAIQPAEFITKNKLSFLEGCVVKRICRKKNRLEDLQKAKHEIDLIIKLEGL